MQKTCPQCASPFEVMDQDLAFYDKISPIFEGKKYPIPSPTFCPTCRSQRRMVWRNELHLFKRKSDFSGKDIISCYPSSADCKVYEVAEWWSDQWDPMEYGRDFDFTRTFFEQFKELLRVVPLQSRSVISNENSDFIHCASWCKNCYLISGANHNEDCYYGNFINYSTDCIDNSFVDHSELCYECINCKNSYNLKYSSNSYDCTDSAFLHNCKSCRNCFGSANLVQKEYVFFNEQLTKEEYEKRLATLELHKRSNVQTIKVEFEKHRLKFPNKFMRGEMNENVSGDSMNNSRNTFECFDVTNVEDCKFCTWFNQSKSCMDIYSWGFDTEECYECCEAGNGSRKALFSISSYGVSEVFYSYYGISSQYLFGCVSLRNKKYCILNKQYTKEEYESLVPRMIEHMKKNGEWGEFFPMNLSPLAYNQTVAQDYMPIEKQKAQQLGAKWNDEEVGAKSDPKNIPPDSILEADETISSKTFTCQKTGKPFKIIPQEFKFYKKQNIPLPDLCWEERHKARLARRNPRKLYDRKCDKCQAPIKTSYAPDRPEIVYCEKCYLEAVY